MTVSHGLPSSYQRGQARRELVERAVAAATGEEYLAILRAIEDWYEFDLVAALLSARLAISPEPIAHRQAKQQSLGREKERRRRPAEAEAE